MNFCKFYNKTMNWFLFVDKNHLGGNPEQKRDNVESISIITGSIEIIFITLLFFTFGILIFIFIKIFYVMVWIDKNTTSKCDKL